MFGLNGSIARSLLDDGIDAARLSELRSAGSWLVLLIGLGLLRPDLLRVDRRELPSLALLGAVGYAGVHATYFLAIDRLEIGVAVTIQYLGPLLVLLWLRLAHGRRLAPGLWGAVALSVAGCFLVVRAYHPGDLDAVGVAAAFGAALTFVMYMVGSERAGQVHEPLTTVFWAFGFATLFWSIVTPWWSFPFAELGSTRHLALGAGVVVIGTLLPFLCMVTALRHVPASRAAVVATLEPVLAALFAWLIHDEALAAVQLAGGLIVVASVAWVQSHRPDLAAEAAPAPRRRSQPAAVRPPA
jgi:drug/metabolite transporter (DMT)-like permease